MEESPTKIESAKSFLEELDSTLHEPVRLGTMMLLHLHSSLAFSVIQKGLGVTSGNLTTHLTSLSTKGYVTKEKMFVNVRPRTVIHITPEGREALKKYSKSLKQILLGMGEI